MAVGGKYLAWQMRTRSIPYFRLYASSILADVLSGFANIDQRRGGDRSGVPALGLATGRRRFRRRHEPGSRSLRKQGQAYYETMTGLRQATINLMAAGLFHLLEQQLANLCYDSAFRECKLKEATMDLIVEWYTRHFDLDLKQLSQWETIKELRLLAHAVKHAEEVPAQKLRNLRPSLFQNPILTGMGSGLASSRQPLRLPLAGDDLFVTEEAFCGYSSAVLDFVTAIASHFEMNAATIYPCGS